MTLKTINYNKIRKSLEEQKSTLTRRLEKDAAANPADNPDRADLAMRFVQDERTGLLAARAAEHLEQIRAALERIDAGTYGLCEQCGRPIHPERLQAIPTARFCIQCKRTL